MIREMVAEARELKAAAGGSVADAMTAWLAPQYLLAVRAQLAALPDGPERLKMLRLTVNDLAALRRGDHTAGHMALERERLAFERKRAARARLSEFWKWTKRPEIKRKLWPPKRGGFTKKTIENIERELRLL
jgi:hypothetical protein